MVKCDDCGQEMAEAETCTWKYIMIDGAIYKRNTDHYDIGERCHDCGIINKKGNIHHFGCDVEQCPKCQGQVFCCDCKRDVLIQDIR